MNLKLRGERPLNQTLVPVPYWALLDCLPAFTQLSLDLLKHSETHDLTAAERESGEQFIRAATAVLDALDAVEKEDSHVS